MTSSLINSQADRDLGPAMRSLSQRHRDFVEYKVVFGLSDVEAARRAAFSHPEHHGWRVAHTPGVQDAILEMSRQLMRTEGPKSIRTLAAIRDNTEAPPRDRIKAATELLNRSGFHQISEHHEHVHSHVSDSEADRRILQLAAELGLDEDSARKMLVAPDDFRRNAEGVYEIAPKTLSQAPPAVAARKRRSRRKGMTPEELAEDIRTCRSRNAKEQYPARVAAGFTPVKTAAEYEAMDALRAAGVVLPSDKS